MKKLKLYMDVWGPGVPRQRLPLSIQIADNASPDLMEFAKRLGFRAWLMAEPSSIVYEDEPPMLPGN
jgi:hypothetical protein